MRNETLTKMRVLSIEQRCVSVQLVATSKRSAEHGPQQTRRCRTGASDVIAVVGRIKCKITFYEHAVNRLVALLSTSSSMRICLTSDEQFGT